ncbi:hypothetical protein D0T11_14890 [Hymenobacter rubripertinctus]|uniref:D-Ala-D-Ala dipeptidase n=2 Tax=Hymenobacter rubripertinctus TaxID=2029981 RepID=A0A418QST8_9BACT|nr:hypothetical protein D0T11_14890 [Hymenobacter rubripertinctus]
MAAEPSTFSITTSAAEYRRYLVGNAEGEMLDVAKLIPGLVLDLRFATAQTLLGRPLYARARALLRRPVAEALQRVQATLSGWGLGLCLYDAYHPYSLTTELMCPPEKLVDPPWSHLPHTRGCAVGVGLVELASQRPLPLPTDFQEYQPATHSGYGQLPAHVLFNRSMLLAAMKQQGFANYPGEWWHYAHQRWADFGPLDISFEELG